MNKLIFNFKNSSDSITIELGNYDFINSINVDDKIKMKNEFFIVENITIERNIVPTHPMVRPSGFHYVVVMIVDLL